MNSFHIHFFKHTGYTASAYLHTLLRATATCKSIHTLHTTLYGEDAQNGTHIPGPGSRITSGDVVAANRGDTQTALLMQRFECMVHLMQNEECSLEGKVSLIR
jgi:hypothetical protein